MVKRRHENLLNLEVFTTGEAATICSVSQQTIIRCFDQGLVKGFKIPGSRFRRIPRAELIKFMKANGIPTGDLEPKEKKVIYVGDKVPISLKDISHRIVFVVVKSEMEVGMELSNANCIIFDLRSELGQIAKSRLIDQEERDLGVEYHTLTTTTDLQEIKEKLGAL